MADNQFVKIEQTYDLPLLNAIMIGAGNTENTSNAPIFQSTQSDFPRGVNSVQTLLNNNVLLQRTVVVDRYSQSVYSS
jgi:hypothetical protein